MRGGEIIFDAFSEGRGEKSSYTHPNLEGDNFEAQTAQLRFSSLKHVRINAKTLPDIVLSKQVFVSIIFIFVLKQ